MAIKEKILVPIRSKGGEPLPLKENFDWKILLAFPDKFIIMNSDQTSIFNRDATPGAIQRVIRYDEVSLDCNVDGNKLCTVKEMMRVDPTFAVLPTIAAMDGHEDRCIVIPIIDSTDRPLNQEMVYVCYPNMSQSAIYLELSKYSRFID